METLRAAGYELTGPVTWEPQAVRGYIAGTVRKRESGHSNSVAFVHGCEEQSPEVMRQLALAANDGRRYLLTTSGEVASAMSRAIISAESTFDNLASSLRRSVR